MDGFKTTERKGVAVSLGERVAVGTVTIEVGTLAETVLVTGEAPHHSGADRRAIVHRVTKESVENLPMTGRNFASFAALAPGVVVSGNNRFARIDGARTNYMLDGISSVNTGRQPAGLAAESRRDRRGQGRHHPRIRPSTAARPAYRFPASPRAARTSSADRFYDIERQGSWNANTWVNAQQRQSEARAEAAGLGLHDRRPGRQARRQEQAVLLLLRTVLTAHERRRRQPLPRADAARTAGGFLADAPTTPVRVST